MTESNEEQASNAAPRAPGALPLTGVRVLDFSRLLPGPWLTQTLGDMGADVIKVEQPGVGDYGRFNPPLYRTNSVYYASVNRNKRSIALDLANSEERAVAHKLAAKAHIVVESFRPGVTKNLGVDYETLKQENPALIYCSMTGFGESAELATTPGHDLSIQGLAGLLVGEPAGEAPPAIPRFVSADYAAGAYGAIAVLGALVRRNASGQGCRIEVPMYDSLMAWTVISSSSALARLSGFTGMPEIENFGNNPRYAAYLAKDRKPVTVALLEARTWRLFCNHISRPDLIYEEGWADRHTAHGAHTEKFRKAIADFCASKDRDALVEECRRHGLPICAAYSPDEALQSREAAIRGIVRFHDHPADGRVPYFADPLVQAGLSDPSRAPAPGLNEHAEEILRELRSDGTPP